MNTPACSACCNKEDSKNAPKNVGVRGSSCVGRGSADHVVPARRLGFSGTAGGRLGGKHLKRRENAAISFPGYTVTPKGGDGYSLLSTGTRST